MYTVFQTHRDDSDWLRMSGRVLISWAILNPNGPTINCLGFAENKGKSDQSEIFWRWMHFLGGESYCLGYVDNDSKRFTEEMFKILQHAVALETGPILKRCPMVTCVPSFLVTSGGDDWNQPAAALLAESRALQEADWGREQYYLSKYGCRFFGRAAEEIRETVETMRQDPEFAGSEGLRLTELMHSGKPEYDNWRPNQYESRPMREGDVEAWCKAVTATEFQGPSIAQLAQMWVGASLRMPDSMPAKTTLDDVRDFLTHFNHTYWPADWSTESVARSMGLNAPMGTHGPASQAVTQESTGKSSRRGLAERISKAVRERFGGKARH